MARQFRAAVIAVAALVLLSAIAGPAAAADPPLRAQFAAPIPTLNATLNVTVILAGLNLSATERAEVGARINTTWLPIITAVNLPLGVNYTVRARIVEASGAFVAAYGDFLRASFPNDTLSRVVGNYIGLFQNVSAYFPSWDESTPVGHADADDAAEWLAAAEGTFPEVAATAGEARLFFLNPYTVDSPYYYSIESQDHDRGTQFTYETANAWGNGAGIFFQDMRAAPSKLGESSPEGRPANFAGAPPLWSYGSSSAERSRLTRDLAGYVDTSVRILLAPSFGVTPFVASSLLVNVTLFDATAAQSLFRSGGVGAAHGINASGDVLDGLLVAAALRTLVPATSVSVVVTVANRSTDAQVAAVVDAHLSSASGERVIDPFGVNQDLRARFGVPALPIAPGDAVTVPALLMAFDDTTWVDAPNVRGVTLQRNDGRAASIMITAGVDQLETLGFSETLVHEAGHALGLGHPHEVGFLAPNGTAVLSVNWLRTSSSTPMTYLPNYVDSSFDSFDRAALEFGAAAATLGIAFQLRQLAYERFDSRGYALATLPAAVATHETLFSQAANQTLSALAPGPSFEGDAPAASLTAALTASKRAYDEALELNIIALTSAQCCNAPRKGFLPGFEAAAAGAALAAAAAFAVRASGYARRGTSSKAEYLDLSRIGVGRSDPTADTTNSDSAERAASSLARAADTARSRAPCTRPK